MPAQTVAAHTAANQCEQKGHHARAQGNEQRAGHQPGDNSHNPTSNQCAWKSAQYGAQNSTYYKRKNKN
ncbi:hypothetical protein D3C76_764720 [compost metagenome]